MHILLINKYPYDGFESDTEIGGRGTSDQMGGIVSAVYGAKIMKDLGMLSDKYQVLVTGTVQEEDCDGLCWQYIGSSWTSHSWQFPPPGGLTQF